MKGIFVGLSMAAALALFSGCASTAPVGALYTDASLPITAIIRFLGQSLPI